LTVSSLVYKMTFSTIGLRELRLGICLRRTNDSGASKPSVLGGNGTESSRNSVNGGRVALFDFVRLVRGRGDSRCCTKPAAAIWVPICKTRDPRSRARGSRPDD